MITIDKLCKICSDKLELKDISLEIYEKEIYGFLGKSESGYEELAALLAGCDVPDSGYVFYKEKSMFSSAKARATIKKKIGYVPSKPSFEDKMTVMEVLDLVGRTKNVDVDKRYRQIKEALELTALNKKENVIIRELSLSEIKRLSLAASLLGNPDAVIMVEPFHYLDRNHAKMIKDIIYLLAKKKAVLIFSSRAADVEEMCSNIAIVSNGKIALYDSKQTILEKLSANGGGSLADVLEAFSDVKEEQ